MKMVEFKRFVVVTLLVVCFSIADSAKRSPTKATVATTCNAADSNGINTFSIQADSSLGRLNFISIQYDTTRKLVATSTILQDSLNSVKNFDRLEPFRPYGCSQIPAPSPQPNCTVGYYMTPLQKTNSGRTNWDRGHLTPANPMRFSEDALNSTFYCVNIAPQDSYTNQNPWRIIEVGTENKLKSLSGMIMTGVCSANNEKDGSTTYRGWVIPQCFWKLACYRDYYTKETKVVGFIGENTLVHISDITGMAERDVSVKTPRSQQEILALVTNSALVKDAWTYAFENLSPGRNTTKLPTASECINALTLSDATAAEWATWIG